MRVLIIKTSSLGDLIHTLPALTDAGQAIPGIQFDWVVEEAFAEIPRWHPLVDRIIPVALRRWRKNTLRALWSGEIRRFFSRLRFRDYDYIIDAQGLIKSAFLTRCARGLRVGLDRRSLTEPPARFAYHNHVSVGLQRHAIDRMRAIFAQALHYPVPPSPPHYAIDSTAFKPSSCEGDYVVFCHGTIWPSKHWSDEHWMQLSDLVRQKSLKIYLPWHGSVEYERAQKIAAHCSVAVVLKRTTLSEIASIILGAQAVISVDTGLGHLAAALGKPTFVLYGPTNPKRIGAIGSCVQHIISPHYCVRCDRMTCQKQDHFSSTCMGHITPEVVWNQMQKFYER